MMFTRLVKSIHGAHTAKALTGVALAAFIISAAHAASETRVLLGIDPSDAGVLMLTAPVTSGQSLSRAIGTRAIITQSSSMADLMRASRTLENDVIVAPAHVTASAILHSYQLLATSGQEQTYALVVASGIASVDQLAGKRIYLPQQDSLRSYVAKGLLAELGFKLSQFSQVTYGNTSGGGLVALLFHMTDATVADEAQALAWLETHPNAGRILKLTRPVPGGMSMVVRKDFCAIECGRLTEWVNSADGQIYGVGRFHVVSADASKTFTYVASLGITTPDGVKGATRVSAEEVAHLATQGASVVDTRTSKEYENEHVPGAILAPYIEKSLKEVDFDAAKDDFTALKTVSKDKSVVFLCNGPECWKSYKASRQAVAAGYSKVYWFRGGMPEWRDKRLAVEGGGSRVINTPSSQARKRVVASN